MVRIIESRLAVGERTNERFSRIRRRKADDTLVC